MAGKDKSLPVKFHLQNGEKMAMGCPVNLTFGQIKDKIWKKKGFPPISMGDYVFVLINGEIPFSDRQSFQILLDIYLPVFEESDKRKKMIELVIVRKDEVGDRIPRENKRPAEFIPIVHQGPLLVKDGIGMSILAFARKRLKHFVLQGCTIYCFETEEAYTQKKQTASTIYFLGAATAKQGDMEGSEYSLIISQLNKDPVQLFSESANEIKSWIHAINQVYIRRTKTIVINCAEELRARKALTSEGIFRVSGSKEEMENIRMTYENSMYPDLTRVKDSHALAGLIKMVIRELPEPLLTFALFEPLIKLADVQSDERTGILKRVLSSLPASHSGLLQYIMCFLHEVSTFSEINKMESKNLSIVFAPNILRPKEETAMTAIQFNRQVLIVVEQMILFYDEIWPREDYLAMFNAPAKSQPAVPQGRPKSPEPSSSSSSSSFSSPAPSSSASMPPSSRPPLVVGGSVSRGPPPPAAAAVSSRVQMKAPPPRPITPGRRSGSGASLSVPAEQKRKPKSGERRSQPSDSLLNTKKKYSEWVVRCESAIAKNLRRTEKIWQDLYNAFKEENPYDDDYDEEAIESKFNEIEKKWSEWEQAMEDMADGLENVVVSVRTASQQRRQEEQEQKLFQDIDDYSHDDDDNKLSYSSALPASLLSSPSILSSSYMPPPPPPAASSSSASVGSSRPRSDSAVNPVAFERIPVGAGPLGPFSGGGGGEPSGLGLALSAQLKSHQSQPVSLPVDDDVPPPPSSDFDDNYEFRCEALYEYTADVEEGEISMKEGERFFVLDSQDPDGWWIARREGTAEEGRIPSNFVKRI